MLLNQSVTADVLFHWFSDVFFSDAGVDVVKYLLANVSQFGFGGVYKSACWVIAEVFFVIFERDESLLFCDAFCFVGDT